MLVSRDLALQPLCRPEQSCVGKYGQCEVADADASGADGSHTIVILELLVCRSCADGWRAVRLFGEHPV